MSLDKSIDCFGMKYDLSNLVISALIESYSEYRKQQIKIRNYLIKQNELEKEENETPTINVIFDIKVKGKKECIVDISEDKLIPKGYFCYPLKGAYFQKSSFEMPFFPLLPLKKFKEGIATFGGQNSLSETYLEYPCLTQKYYEKIKNKIINDNPKKPIANNDSSQSNNLPVRPSNCTSNINTFFVIWSFIKVLKGQMIIMDEDFQKVFSKDKDKIIIPIVEEMSKHLKIEINILYYIINTFFNECKKKVSRDSISKRGISYSKYEKYWCRICNRFFCPFHFKIKVKTKSLFDGKIRTSYENFKKIQITLRPPEYLYKEQNENEQSRQNLYEEVQEIINNCDCCQNKSNYRDTNDEHFIFDESLRYNKMAQIKNKEDFFVLCKMIKTCNKLLNKIYENDKDKDKIIDKFLSPCVVRKILHNKYDCGLLKYLIKLIKDSKYLKDINIFLKNLSGVSYENLPEENLLFFNNPIDSNLSFHKYNDKGEQKIIKMLRTKTTARLQVQSQKNLYYKPCDHYPAECTPENCDCAKQGICLKYCCCFKEESLTNTSNACQYIFLGCQHHTSRTGVNCSGCYCIKANIECIPGICNCGEKCLNNNITFGKRKKLIYGYSNRIKGGGLFAGEDIKDGEFIDVYGGEMVERDELDRLSIFYDQTGNNYPFSINNKFDYVSIKCGGLTRFINHGSYDEENVTADKKMVNGIPYIAFYANRDIDKYEELFYNYSYDKSSMPDWMKEYNRHMEMKIKKEEQNKLYHQNKYNKKNENKKKGKTLHKVSEKEKEEEINKNSSKSIKLDEEEEEEEKNYKIYRYKK